MMGVRGGVWRMWESVFLSLSVCFEKALIRFVGSLLWHYTTVILSFSVIKQNTYINAKETKKSKINIRPFLFSDDVCVCLFTIMSDIIFTPRAIYTLTLLWMSVTLEFWLFVHMSPPPAYISLIETETTLNLLYKYVYTSIARLQYIHCSLRELTTPNLYV